VIGNPPIPLEFLSSVIERLRGEILCGEASLETASLALGILCALKLHLTEGTSRPQRLEEEIRRIVAEEIGRFFLCDLPSLPRVPLLNGLLRG
jgi:hypothetical protein